MRFPSRLHGYGNRRSTRRSPRFVRAGPHRPPASVVTNVEYTEKSQAWWNPLSEREQNDVSRIVDMLAEHCPHLLCPHCSAVEHAAGHEHVPAHGPRRLMGSLEGVRPHPCDRDVLG